MIPRLYNEQKNIDIYSKNGYGFFDACKKCEVTEERNGEYYLVMECLETDSLAPYINVNKIIKAKANNDDDPQLFEIIEVKKQKNVLKIKANHIKYLWCQNVFGDEYAEYNYINQTFTGTPQEIMAEILDDNYLCFNQYFTFTSDITASSTVAVNSFLALKFGDFLSGTRGGLLDVFGGEYHFDNFTIELLNRRGNNTNKKIMWGYNLSDYTQTITNDNNYTHVIGYAKVKDLYKNNKESIMKGEAVQCVRMYSTFEKIKLVDVTEEVKELWNFTDYTEPTMNSGTGFRYDDVRNLVNTATRNYVRYKNYSALADVNIKVTYTPDLEKLQDCKLCDTVNVFFKDKTSVQSKINKVVYDSLREKYIKMEIGSKAMKLEDFLTKKRR